MNLKKENVEWALIHLKNYGDGDVLPHLLEIDALEWAFDQQDTKKQLLKHLCSLEIEHHIWGNERRFLIPKSSLIFRKFVQLDPFDSLLLASIIKQYGNDLEKSRLSIEEGVFSYRFHPSEDGSLYGHEWKKFWKKSIELAQSHNYVLVTDISDFYRQINRHALENELKECNLPENIIKALEKLLSKVQHKLSTGVPAGPHPLHYIAEIALNPIDRALKISKGFLFLRYVDDFHFFFSDKNDQSIIAHDFTKILDDEMKLTMNRTKTKLYSSKEFISHAEKKIKSDPHDLNEEKVLKIISKKTDDSPYRMFADPNLKTAEKKQLSEDKIKSVINRYIQQYNNPDTNEKSKEELLSKIGYLLRRFAQLKLKGAEAAIIDSEEIFLFCIGDVVKYLSSITYSEVDTDFVDKILQKCMGGFFQHSEYLKTLFLNLFFRVPAFDHFSKISRQFQSDCGTIQRELILIASNQDDKNFIKSLKDKFSTMDTWSQRAMIYATSKLSGDEGKHWLGGLPEVKSHLMNSIIASYAFRKPTYINKFFENS